MELESVTLSVWFLIGAVLVFFMQSGFAMVECGFTRAKNAGNILMKNLVDFCLGTVVFILLGYGLLVGPHVAGGADQVLRLLPVLHHHQPGDLPHRGRLGLGGRRMAGRAGLH